ncbi:MAG: Txe/YoeB family addiction module toxin [Rhodoferax sp.]|nr:Txe/YoeB family addiction module toxin [Rhodoferax sp.]
MRIVCFVPVAWSDYLYWQGQDKKTLKRINALIGACARDPFAGIGKPEPLIGNLAGYWSRLGCPKMLQNNQFLSPKKWPYLPEQENVVLRFMISRIVTGTSS